MDIVYHPLLALIQLGLGAFPVYIGHTLFISLQIPKVILIQADFCGFLLIDFINTYIPLADSHHVKNDYFISQAIRVGNNDRYVLSVHESIFIAFLQYCFRTISYSNLATCSSDPRHNNLFVFGVRDPNFAQSKFI